MTTIFPPADSLPTDADLLIGTVGCPDGQWLAQLLGQLEAQAMGGAIVHARRPVRQTEGVREFLVEKALHTNEHAAWPPFDSQPSMKGARPAQPRRLKYSTQKAAREERSKMSCRAARSLVSCSRLSNILGITFACYSGQSWPGGRPGAQVNVDHSA